MTDPEVVMAEIWLNGNVLIEKRWEDIKNPETGEIQQEVRYALPGGKVEHGESQAEAIIREVKEETGIVLSPDDPDIANADPEVVQEKPDKVVLFRKLLRGHVQLKDGILICTPPEIIDFADEGKLMSYSKMYVDKEYRIPNGLIDN